MYNHYLTPFKSKIWTKYPIWDRNYLV